ncbi:MAG: hypothetical protein GY906_35410 [bacterium]|nr:hypothetical protein [bacterium]
MKKNTSSASAQIASQSGSWRWQSASGSTRVWRRSFDGSVLVDEVWRTAT